MSGIAPPDFSAAAQPHALLARYPISVYLTTNYDNYTTLALQQLGKAPVTKICPWYLGADRDEITKIPRGFKPSSDEPLVYHLHGSFEQPASLVLTEEDYLEFLITLTQHHGVRSQSVIPPQVVLAMARQPLLFVGYSLRDWSFRTLFRGLRRTVAEVHRRRHVSIQLAPLSRRHDDEVRSRAEDYLRSYYDKLNISVYWGSAREFCEELDRRLQPGDH